MFKTDFNIQCSSFLETGTFVGCGVKEVNGLILEIVF